MTHFLCDILRQPKELQGVIDLLCRGARSTLEKAAGSSPLFPPCVFDGNSIYCFLAGSTSLGSCHETHLPWEEGASGRRRRWEPAASGMDLKRSLLVRDGSLNSDPSRSRND